MSFDSPAGHADERTMLLGWLDLYRDVMVMKLEGLSEAQARIKPTPDGNALINLIVHLTGVERNWFQRTIGGKRVERDRDSEFETITLTVDEAVAAYRAECARSNEVVAEFEDVAEPCRGEAGYSVRWVLHHMLEETARHAGHADITRELIDGSVGWNRTDRG